MNKFVKGHPGFKPKGAVSKKVALRNILDDLLNDNQDEVRVRFLKFLRNQKNDQDFKWLMDLIASMQPKNLMINDVNLRQGITLIMPDATKVDLSGNQTQSIPV